MGRVAKGFKKLEGVTIVKVVAKAVNAVTLYGSDGTVYEIEGESGFLGIAHLSLERVKQSKEPREIKLKTHAADAKQKHAFPYPPVNGSNGTTGEDLKLKKRKKKD